MECRNYRQVWIVLALLALMFAAQVGLAQVSAQEYVLVRDGAPAATIVLAEKPTRAAQLGALELQHHVRLISDVTLPIVDDTAEVEGLKLYVGPSKQANAPTDFEDLEYAILFRPNAIVMAGKDKQDFGEVKYWIEEPLIEGAYNYPTWPDLFDERGSLNAVYDFLRDYCGVRWFDPSEFGTDVPRTQTLSVTAKDLRRIPGFRYMHYNGFGKQNADFYDGGRSNWKTGWSNPLPQHDEWISMIYEKGKQLPVTAHPHRWLAYQRSQVWAFWMRHKQGGEAWKCNHSFYHWYDRFWEENPKNPDVFVEKKPDWFAQGYPDAQVPPQLCYTNPEVVEQCLKEARDFFALSPEERAKTTRLGTDRYWAVVPMDNSGYCKCPRCSALLGEDDTGLFSKGRHSRLVWSFINQVAAGLKETHPDKMVAALAYAGYARRPQDMEIAENIAVQLCIFPRAAATNPEMLANDDAMLQEWADGRPIYLWLYTPLTTGHMPQSPMYPGYMGSLYDDLFRKYQKAGARGIFFNGIPPEPEPYLLFRLGDNPQLDADELLDDYFLRMFGPAAGPTLREFYRLNEAAFINPRNHPQGIGGADLWWGALGTASRMAAMGELIARAEEQLTDAPELWRKRFAIFKLAIWEYMRVGRENYEKSKVAQASKPVSFICPATLGEAAGGDLDRVDWREAQGFGSHKCWIKDSGDISLRHIASSMLHDGGHMYLKFVETQLDRQPGAGDSWEVALFDPQTAALHRLVVDRAGAVTGQVQGAGVPQEWAAHGASAISRVAEDRWEVVLALPAQNQLLDPRGRMLINCRRNDATGEDTAVLVATGNDFESGKTGALITFDPFPAAIGTPAPPEDLILDCDFSGTGDKVEDRSGRDNHGLLFGGLERGDRGLIFTTGGQYVEFPPLRGLNPNSFSVACWVRFPATRQTRVMPAFQIGTLFWRLSTPGNNAQLFWANADGKQGGAGTGGVELTPDLWHLIVLTHDGERFRAYINGRERGSFQTKVLDPLTPQTIWRLGGGPKSAPWYTFGGTFGRTRIYGRTLSGEEILGLFRSEYPTWRAVGDQ